MKLQSLLVLPIVVVMTSCSSTASESKNSRVKNAALSSTTSLALDNYDGQNLETRSFLDLDLTGKSFVGANLQRASFHRSILERANFSNANLDSSNLTKTYLYKTNFSGANLQRAESWSRPHGWSEFHKC